MKKLAPALCLLLALAMLAGCGGSSGGQYGSNADYRQVLLDARSDDVNNSPMFSVVTGPDDDFHDMFFSDSFGFVEADMERYAMSLGTMIVQAYGVAIILPVEGREDAVLDQVNAFVEAQKRAQENYLHDQYEIAKSALVRTMPTGEVVLVMSEGAPEIMAAIEEGLAAGAA